MENVGITHQTCTYVYTHMHVMYSYICAQHRHAHIYIYILYVYDCCMIRITHQHWTVNSLSGTDWQNPGHDQQHQQTLVCVCVSRYFLRGLLQFRV